MFCPHCGKEITDGATFCDHCGKPIAAQANAPEYPKPDKAPEQDVPDLKEMFKGAKITAKPEIRTPFGSGAKGLVRTVVIVVVIVVGLALFKACSGM